MFYFCEQKFVGMLDDPRRRRRHRCSCAFLSLRHVVILSAVFSVLVLHHLISMFA